MLYTFLNYTFKLGTNWLAAIILSTFNQKLKKKKKKIIFKDIFLSFVRLDIYNITHNGDAAPQSLDMCYRMAPRLCQQIGATHVEATTMAFPETWYVSLVVSDTSSRVAAAA